MLGPPPFITPVVCPHCDTQYLVYEGKAAAEERTMDMEPPDHVIVWEVDEGSDTAEFLRSSFARGESPPILHECRQGKPVNWLDRS